MGRRTISKSTFGYIAIIMLLSFTSLISLNLFFHQRSDYDMLDIHTFPHVINDWRGTDLKITEKEYQILETRNLISREYINAANEKLHLFIVYSETNRSVFHPPEVCIIGSGITINDMANEELIVGKNEFLVKKLYLEKDNHTDIALYCYKAGSLYIDNFYLQQIYFTLNQLFGKHKGGATIRVSMPVGESEETILATLKSFMTQTIKTFDNL